MRVLLKRGEERGKGENVGMGAGAVSAPSNRERRRLQEVGDDKRTPPGSEREEGEERCISSFFSNKFSKLLSNGI